MYRLTQHFGVTGETEQPVAWDLFHRHLTAQQFLLPLPRLKRRLISRRVNRQVWADTATGDPQLRKPHLRRPIELACGGCGADRRHRERITSRIVGRADRSTV